MNTEERNYPQLEWTTELHSPKGSSLGECYRAQGLRRVYWVDVLSENEINPFRPRIQRGAVSFLCSVAFAELKYAKHFCQSDSDSIYDVIHDHIPTTTTPTFTGGVQAMAWNCLPAVELVRHGRWTLDDMKEWLQAVVDTDATDYTILLRGKTELDLGSARYGALDILKRISKGLAVSTGEIQTFLNSVYAVESHPPVILNKPAKVFINATH